MEPSRSPHGERGLKCRRLLDGYHYIRSLSSRRAWIEMRIEARRSHRRDGRSPHGERGLKFMFGVSVVVGEHGRSPHGERGLKWCGRRQDRQNRFVALLTESVD